jgi:hypothetical protein
VLKGADALALKEFVPVVKDLVWLARKGRLRGPLGRRVRVLEFGRWRLILRRHHKSSKLSVDHRGADRAGFLKSLQAALSDWELLL